MSLILAKIKIEIIDFRFCSRTKRHLNKDDQIRIKLCAFGFIPIFKTNITKIKLEKMKLKEKIKDFDFNELKDHPKLDRNILTIIKNINIGIRDLELYVEIGTENASLTAILVPIIIAIVLHKKVKDFDHQIFVINPVYQNRNLVNISVSGIFEIKISHIINIIYMLNRKEKKGVKEYERTSHRRSYGYSYE